MSRRWRVAGEGIYDELDAAVAQAKCLLQADGQWGEPSPDLIDRVVCITDADDPERVGALVRFKIIVEKEEE